MPEAVPARRHAAAVVLLAPMLCWAGSAAADEEAAPGLSRVPHARHWSLGVGGFSALTGPAGYGPSAGAELYPGGGFGRYGIRAELRGFEDREAGHASVGVTYEAAASRPRLQLALHAEIGIAHPGREPTVGGGVQTHLWLTGPVALAFDGGAVLFFDGTDSALALGSSVQLRIAY